MKTISLANVTISLAEAARLIGKSPPWIKTLVKDGYLKRAGRGLYKPGAVAQAHIAFLVERKKETSRGGTLSQVQAARAREIALRIARTENKLITTEEMVEIVDEIIGGLKADCDGVSASVTRDQTLRNQIERALDVIFTRAADRLEQKADDLSPGGAATSSDRKDAA